MSEYVLARVLPPPQGRFVELTGALASPDYRFALAELNDFLAACPPVLFGETVARTPADGLSRYLLNYVAAMVEQAAEQKGMRPPEWTRSIAPLAVPHFVSPLASLRLHLLRSAPVPFKRRNIFVDSGVGARV